MAFHLPRLPSALPIVDKLFRATPDFQRYWQTFADTIERQENRQDELLASQAALLEAVQTQQAQLAITQAQLQATIEQIYPLLGESGSDIGSVNITSNGTWFPGPQVDLTGVAGGTLTMLGSFNASTGGGAASGNWRLVEIVGGIDTELTWGSWHTYGTDYPGEFPFTLYTYVNDDAAAVNSYSAARGTTGAVSYRADYRSAGGSQACSLTNITLNVARQV